MKKAQHTSRLAVAILAAVLMGSVAAPRTFGWGAGLAAAADEEPIDGEPIAEESADPGDGAAPDESPAPDPSQPTDETPQPEPGEEPGAPFEPGTDPGPADGDVDAPEVPSSDEPLPTPAPLTLGDLLGAATASRPLDAELALQILRDFAPTGARAVEVADRPSFRDARTYALREVRGWSRLPTLGVASAVVWMRFVGGSERTPFAVDAGRDRTDPRIGSIRVREGRASHGNPPPYLLTVSGTDAGTGAIAVEVRVGHERPLRLPFGEASEIGPFVESTGGRVVLLTRGVTIEVRLVDAAGNESSWRRVRLP